MNQQINTRTVILDILTEVNENGQFVNKVLNSALKKYQYLPRNERAFISRTVLGSVERRITLDYIIDIFSKVKTVKLKPVIRNILRMSVYQIIYMDGIKDFAVCNEGVKLASKRGFANLKGYVNGVLRNIVRNKDNIKMPDADKDILFCLSVKYSMPQWIIKMWIEQKGMENTVKMLEAQFEKRPLTIRCNCVRITPEELCERFNQKGIKAEISPYLPEALEISGFDYLEGLEEFKEGLFFVQDISSMLVCHAADPKEGDYVIDLCAAPGGKSTHIAETLHNTGTVESRDLTYDKVELINDNIERLGLTNINTAVYDACVADKDLVGKADIVIADLPCSGLGIINKKPDIKYHATMEGCEELAGLQRKILSVAAEYVKPGGVLVYSTCTVNMHENFSNASWFCHNFPFHAADITGNIPKEFAYSFLHPGKENDDRYLEIIPGTLNNHENAETNTNYDGFFIAKFVRDGN